MSEKEKLFSLGSNDLDRAIDKLNEEKTVGVDDYLTSLNTDEHHIDGKHKLYKRRWIMLALYSILNMTNALLWITFAPISQQVSSFYHIGDFWVNSLSMIFMFMYVPVTFPGSYLTDLYGLRVGLFVGAVLSCLGAFVRCFGIGPDTFAITFIGQTICGISQPFILNAPPKVAANWFGAEERTLATTIGAVANPVGVAIGFVMPPLFAGKDEQMIPVLLASQMVMTAVALFLIAFFFVDKPPIPPSSSQETPIHINYMTSLKILCTDINFLLLLSAFSGGLGGFNTLATLLNEIFVKYDYTDNETGVMGASVVIFGLVGSGLAGFLVDKYHRYKVTLLTCFTVSTVICIALDAILEQDRFWYLLPLAAMLGFFMTPTLAVGMELGCEISHPIGETTVAGLLNSGGQIVGIFQILIMGELIEHSLVKWSILVVIICTALSTFALVFFNGTLKRLISEEEKRNEDEPFQKPSF